MQKHLKRNIAIGAAALVAVGGGGIAVAATTSKSGNDDRAKAFLENAAKRLNVTPDALSSALEGAFGDQLDQAVKDGKLTQAQADAMKKRIAENGLPIGGIGGPRGFGGPGGKGGPGGPGIAGPRASLKAAADYLGLTEAELRTKLEKSGTSLADVAKAQNKDVAGLEAAIVAATKKELDQAVTDKKLTAEQRDEIVKDLDARVKEQVENARPTPPKGKDGARGGHARGFGFGGPGGPGGPPAAPDAPAPPAP